MKRNKGFTLIELMVVVAIIGILAAVAVPAYGNYVIRGKIAEAMTQLSGLRVSMEQYYQDNRTYVGGLGCNAVNDSIATTGTKYFTFSCTAIAVNAYTITATGINSMANFTYSINQQNAKSSNITAAGWSNPNPNNCWAIKQDGSC